VQPAWPNLWPLTDDITTNGSDDDGQLRNRSNGTASIRGVYSFAHFARTGWNGLAVQYLFQRPSVYLNMFSAAPNIGGTMPTYMFLRDP